MAKLSLQEQGVLKDFGQGVGQDCGPMLNSAGAGPTPKRWWGRQDPSLAEAALGSLSPG